MLIQCTHKGCYAQDHHLLDIGSDEVTCNNCGNAINLPPTTKKALVTMNQIRKTPKSGLTFKCKSCGHNSKPLLKTLSGGVTIATCRKCDKQIDMHPSFILAMREMGADYLSNAPDAEEGDG
jgi:transcription elongation factor Elf1